MIPPAYRVRRVTALVLLTCALAGVVSVGEAAPAGWSNQDIGSPSVAGSASFATNTATWTVSGSGSDIWNTSDQFHFASRTLNGDGSIIARVASMTGTHPYAKAGVMLRTDTNASAAFADVVVTASNSVSFQWRATNGGTASAIYAGGIVSVPIWVRLTRAGGTFSGAFSYDATNWFQLGTGQSLTMNPSALAGLAVTAINNTNLNTATFTGVSLVANGWNDFDVGTPGLAGWSTFDGSTWSVSGSGADIWSTSDQFHFANQKCVGDLTLIARVDNVTSSGAYAKAGLMIRDGTAANAGYAFIFLTPSTGAGGQGANFEYRSGTGIATVSTSNTAGITAPRWLKLVRSNNTFTAFQSADGVNWIANGTRTITNMSRTVNVGLAVSANNNAARNTATFSHLSVLPSNWDDADIGAPGLAGSASFDGRRFAVRGGGTDIWGTGDQFNFASRTFVGDVTIVARVESQIATGTYAKAGLMIRDGTASNASHVITFLTPDTGASAHQANFEYRNGTGASAQGGGSTAGISAPVWLKLVRAGNTFTAWYSTNGVNWIANGSQVVPMNLTVNVGLVVDANNNAALNSAIFDQVQVGAPINDPFLKASAADFRNGHGTGDDVNLRGSNLGGWLLHEDWIEGMDSSGLPDDISVRNTLQNRFGEATANRLIAEFELNWITELDLDNIAALGLNVLRVPFSYRNVVNANLTWRADAFTRLDWIVDEAWKRGIYVILDLHGAPGGASPFTSSGQSGGGALWTDANLQNLTTNIWGRVAQHFAGHPGIAAYDLINEPVPPSYNALWTLYDRCYNAVRAVDSDHVVMMEGGGGAGVGNSYWSLSSLPDPATYGWANVAYQTHSYATDGGTGAEGEAGWQVTQKQQHSSWNVPILIGEFNLGDRENFAVQLWDDNNLNWTSWTYKRLESPGGTWGIYAVTGSWPYSPNLQTYPAAQIISDYATKTTSGHFGTNPYLANIFATPLLRSETYSLLPGGSLYVPPASGVLANDIDAALGQPGIALHAYLVNSTTHGALTLYDDGSFSYTPTNGFAGTDTFRYRVWDNHNDSGNIATVNLVVLAPPVSPTGLSAVTTDGEVVLIWFATAGATSYNVKRALTNGGPYLTIASIVVTTNFTDTNVIPLTPYYYVVSAVNGAGESSNSAPVSAIVAGLNVTPTFIAAGANWRYFDQTNDLGISWRSNSFSDATWSNGLARLGYGNDGEVTKISSNRQWTTYFRRQFYVPNPALVTAFNARLTRDDAAILYLNGAEIWRDTNITSGTVTYTTPALVALGGTDETNWLTLNLPLSILNLLTPGWNTLAAEVHNQSLTSSDLGFNFELTGIAVIAAPPLVTIAAAAGSLTISWPLDGSYFALYSATNLSPPIVWTPLTNTPALISNQWRLTLPIATNGSRFYRLRIP